jgi:hypothetical protein
MFFAPTECLRTIGGRKDPKPVAFKRPLLVELDFVQQDDSSGSIYTARVSVGGCEDCGYIELYGLIHTSY